MRAIELCHAYLIGATIHTPDGNRSPTKEEVIKAIMDELNQVSTHAEGCWSWGPSHYMCAYRKCTESDKHSKSLNQAQ